MKRKFMSGHLRITVNFMERYSPPPWGRKHEEARPEYSITISSPQRRMRVKSWGNLVSPLDVQHGSLASGFLNEIAIDPGSFEEFCGEFGYELDSLHAYKTWQLLKKRYANGHWAKYMEFHPEDGYPVLRTLSGRDITER